jgi:hypothetical protein
VAVVVCLLDLVARLFHCFGVVPCGIVLVKLLIKLGEVLSEDERLPGIVRGDNGTPASQDHWLSLVLGPEVIVTSAFTTSFFLFGLGGQTIATLRRSGTLQDCNEYLVSFAKAKCKKIEGRDIPKQSMQRMCFVWISPEENCSKRYLYFLLIMSFLSIVRPVRYVRTSALRSISLGDLEDIADSGGQNEVGWRITR